MTVALPSNFLTLLASSTTEMMNSVSGVAALIFGILLAFLVIELVIGALRKNENDVR